MGDCLLGVDIGTSACKVALFDTKGNTLAQSSHEYPVSYPKPGWAEQDPELWWRSVCASVRQVLEVSGVAPGEIAGIGVDGQSWSAVAVDKQGRTLCPTPIWTDTRAQAECAQLESRISRERLFVVSGNPLQPSYTLPKILWYKNQRPEVYRRADAILQSNSFIVYRLTGVRAQDPSQGYGLACFDMRKRAWDRALAEEMGIRASLLPELYPCHQVVGRVTEEAARLTGLCSGIPVVAGGLDAACGTLGAGVVDPGQTQEQGGQAGGMSLCMDRYAADLRLILGCHVVPDRWLLQGGSTGGGGALKWFREQCCRDLTFEEMSDCAAAVPAGSEGVVFLPYMAGERSPIWNPNARGVFFGLDYSKGRGHMIRAVMEGVAYSLRHNLETAAQAGAVADTLRAMGGSSNSRVWTQLKADITGRRIEVPGGDTATTLGAALLAGTGTGLYPDFARATRETVTIRRVHTPKEENRAIYDAGYARYRELGQALAPLMR